MSVLRLIPVILVALFLTSGCTPTEQVIRISGPTMGTSYHISWVGIPDSAEQERIKKLVDERLADINRLMSTYDPESELSVINREGTGDGWYDVSIDLYRVLLMSTIVNRASDQAFDITVGPLVNLWGFGPDVKTNAAPEDSSIQTTLQQTGADVLKLRPRDETYQIKLEQPRYLDLSGIAKGYAVDELARLLQKEGNGRYLVEVGGEIAAAGLKPDGTHWRIAIEAPLDGNRSAQKIIELNGLGVATSGDYRNYFEEDGLRYSHTIDGRTGYPVRHKLASVSVMNESVAMADAWATALMVVGDKEGVALAEKLDLAAFFIIREGDQFREVATSHFNRLTQ